jgi:diguanylate cyclase (GGDEF)-like protein
MATGSDRAWRSVAIAGISLTAVAVALPAGTVRAIAYAGAQFVGLAGVLLGARRARPVAGLSWYPIGLALAASAASNLLWNLSTAPVAAGWLYLAVYPPLVAGLVGLARTRIDPRPDGGTDRRHGWRPEVSLDTAILTVGVAAIYWTFLVYPVLVKAGLPDVTRQVVVAHAALDLAVIAAGGRLFFRTGARITGTRLLLLAVVGTLTGDVVYYGHAAVTGSFANGRFSDAAWIASGVLVGVAALHPSSASAAAAQRRTAQPSGAITFVLLALLGPVLVFAGVAIGERAGDRYGWEDATVGAGLSAALSVLLVLRLGLMTRVARQRAAALAAQAVRLGAALAEQEDLQRRLTQHALYDPLTGLPNRVLLMERLDRALVRRHGTQLVMLDLDGFTEINDGHGHQTGDAVLVEVSHRLLGVLDAADTLARLGADQFAVLLEDADPERAELTAADLRDALRPRYQLDGRALTVTASVGVLSARQPTTASEALRDADLAVRAAKRGGRDRIVVFEPALRTARLDYTRLAGRLRQALTDGEFALHYQPVVELATNRVVAVETLLRWSPPGGDPISPVDFIPVAEDNGLIVPIGTWVLDQACRHALPWWLAHRVRTTVNVSGHQLRDPAFPGVVRAVLRSAGLPGEALVLEITESALIAETTAAAAAASTLLDEVRELGVRVAIDDFGTGYSSLAYLRHLPVDILKIDKAFVGGAEAGPQDRAFLRAIVQLAETLGLATIGEGVETHEQAALLRMMNCGLAQGFLFHRPQPPEAIDAVLARSPAAAHLT